METKNITQIFEEMFSAFSEKTQKDLSRESDLGVRLYTLAAQLKSLYMQAEWVKAQCFPQTAAGENLDLHADTRGLLRRGGIPSSGIVRFYGEPAEDVQVPEGTVLLGPNLSRFYTTQATVLEKGQTYTDAAARAELGGEDGNIAAGEINAMALPVPGIRAVSNPAAFSGGTDAEDDEALRTRILETFKRLPNGSNAVFYETEAMKIEGVESAAAIGRARGRGTVDLYISTRDGQPDTELLNRVFDALNEKREICVDLQVKAPVKKNVALSLAIKQASGVSFQTLKPVVETAVYAFFTGALLGKPVYIARLHSLILGVPGVENVKITAPAADIQTAPGELPSLLSIAITEMAG